MIFLIFFIALIIPATYVFIYFNYQDTSLPKLALKDYKKVLVIYPHPDDEIMMSIGVIRKLIEQKINIEVVSLTKGEKGDELLKLSPEALGKIRSEEFAKVMKVIGAEDFQMHNFGDGKINDNYKSVKLFVKELINANKYDLVVTYEKNGLYGHSDHVALSKMINELQSELESFDVLYSTIPKKISQKLNIKEHMKNIELKDFDWNEEPNFSLSIWQSLVLKYKAAKLYKSQKLSHGMPLWFSILLMPIEYYKLSKVGKKLS